MKIGIIIYSNETETVWNAFRLGIYSIGKNDKVKIFLLGKGVESDQLDTDQFKVTEQISDFIRMGGEILACGTCLKVRELKESETCPLSTMDDLHKLVHDSDRVVTF